MVNLNYTVQLLVKVELKNQIINNNNHHRHQHQQQTVINEHMI